MKTSHRLLWAALALQIVLFIVLSLRSSESKIVKAKTLLSFNSANVKTITITERQGDKKEQQLKLIQKGNHWVLDQSDDFPLKDNAVKDFLAKLSALKAKSPVATKKSHYRKLQVGKESFGRKVSLELDQGKNITFYLGSSSGKNRVHFRQENKKDVYEAYPLASWDISAQANKWVDTKYMKVDADKVVAVELKNKNGTITLRKEKSIWSDASGKTLDQQKVKSLVSSISSIDMKKPISKVAKSEFGLDHPFATLIVKVNKKVATSQPMSLPANATDQAAATQPSVIEISHRFVIGKKTSDGYYAHYDQASHYVEVDGYSVDSIVNKKLDDLVKKAKKEAKLSPPQMPFRPSHTP